MAEPQSRWGRERMRHTPVSVRSRSECAIVCTWHCQSTDRAGFGGTRLGACLSCPPVLGRAGLRMYFLFVLSCCHSHVKPGGPRVSLTRPTSAGGGRWCRAKWADSAIDSLAWHPRQPLLVQLLVQAPVASYEPRKRNPFSSASMYTQFRPLVKPNSFHPRLPKPRNGTN